MEKLPFRRIRRASPRLRALFGIALGTSLFIALQLGLGSWDFLPIVLVFGLTLYLGVVGLAALVVSGLFAIGRSPSRRASAVAARTVAVRFLVSAGVGLLTVVLGIFVAHARVEHAKSWLTHLVPTLDEYRRVHGTYPALLEEVVPSGIPWSIRKDDLAYAGDVQSFHFDLMSGPISGWSFESQFRLWSYYD